MNYITEILGFNDSLLTKPLAAGQIALWYALMYINNKCSWAEWFTAPNRTLESLTGLERSSIYRARNELKIRGLIDFRSNGTKACSYKMLTCCTEQQDTQQGAQQPTQQPTQQGTQQPTQPLNKQNKSNVQMHCSKSSGPPIRTRRERGRFPTRRSLPFSLSAGKKCCGRLPVIWPA